MSLQARLDQIRGGFEKEAPAEVLAVMHRFSVFLFSSFVLLAYWLRLGWIIMQS